MKQLIDQDIQCVSQVVSPSLEELHPIRIGAVVQQPQPDIRDVVYVGLSSLVPAGLRALCSCAGLMYARVRDLQVGGDLYQIEVAALAHYFEAPSRTRDRHVRSIVLPAKNFALLLEWDRSLAGKATCDVRELMEEHVAIIQAQQADTKDEPEHQHAAEDTRPQGDTGEKEDDLEILTSVFVPRMVIRETFDTWHITARRERRVQSALLVAAMEMVDWQIEHCHSLQERDRLEATYKEIRAVRRWRRERRNAGYGWQRVVTLTPLVSGTGWDLVIGKPAA